VTGPDVAAVLATSGLTVYYVYPKDGLDKTMPCLTYKLDRRSIEGDPHCKTTITATIHCSLASFVTLSGQVDAMIARLPCLDRDNVRRVDTDYMKDLDIAECTWTIPVQM
jgi:hypothetical protein